MSQQNQTETCSQDTDQLLADLPDPTRTNALLKEAVELDRDCDRISDLISAYAAFSGHREELSKIRTKIKSNREILARIEDNLSDPDIEDERRQELQANAKIQKQIIQENEITEKGSIDVLYNDSEAILMFIRPSEQDSERERHSAWISSNETFVEEHSAEMEKLKARHSDTTAQLKNLTKELGDELDVLRTRLEKISEEFANKIVGSAHSDRKNGWLFSGSDGEPLDGKYNEGNQPDLKLEKIVAVRLSDFELEERLREVLDHLTYDRIREEMDAVTYNSRLNGFLDRAAKHLENETKIKSVLNHLKAYQESRKDLDDHKRNALGDLDTSELSKLRLPKGTSLGALVRNYDNLAKKEKDAAEALTELIEAYRLRLKMVKQRVLDPERNRSLTTYCAAVSNAYTAHGYLRWWPFFAALVCVFVTKYVLAIAGQSFLAEYNTTILILVFAGVYFISKMLGNWARQRAMKTPQKALRENLERLLNNNVASQNVHMSQYVEPFRLAKITSNSWRAFCKIDKKTKAKDLKGFSKYDPLMIILNVVVVLMPLILPIGMLLVGQKTSPAVQFVTALGDGRVCSLAKGRLVHASLESYFVDIDEGSQRAEKPSFSFNFLPEFRSLRVPKNNVVLVSNGESFTDCKENEPQTQISHLSRNLDNLRSETQTYQAAAKDERTKLATALESHDTTMRGAGAGSVPPALFEKVGDIEETLKQVHSSSVDQGKRIQLLEQKHANLGHSEAVPSKVEELESNLTKLRLFVEGMAAAETSVIVEPGTLTVVPYVINSQPKPSEQASFSFMQVVTVNDGENTIASDTVLMPFFSKEVTLGNNETRNDKQMSLAAFKAGFDFNPPDKFEEHLFEQLRNLARDPAIELRLDLRGFASASWKHLIASGRTQEETEILKKKLNYYLAEGRRAAVLEALFQKANLPTGIKIRAQNGKYECLKSELFDSIVSGQSRRFKDYSDMRNGVSGTNTEQGAYSTSFDELLNRSVSLQVEVVPATEETC